MQAEQLKLSSQRWMAAALAAFAQGSESYDFAVHHAGVAAEHLLKAYLASLHPALVVEGKDFNSLLHATGHSTLASAPVSQARTIGIVEAHLRVHKILRKQIPIDQKAFAPVANARNGVAHIGVHEAAEVQTTLTTCLRVIDPLLAELAIEPDDYWGSYRSLHDRLIEERARAHRIQLEGKLARARAIFEQRYGHLSTKETEVVLATVTVTRQIYMDHAEQRECPACGSNGWLIGDTHIDATNEPVVVFTPYVFACSACDLELENEDFWELRDLGAEIVLDDPIEDHYPNWAPDPDLVPDDPEDAAIEEAESWEPDEDLLRGR